MKDDIDFTLALDLEDITLLENVFVVNAPDKQEQIDRRLMVATPDTHFSFDVKTHRNILRAIISIQYALFDNSEVSPTNQRDPEGTFQLLQFSVTCGVVITSPLMDETPIAPRHLAQRQSAEDHRDKRMERVMLTEAIKAAYSFASNRLLEQSSLSPYKSILMPVIDTDEILNDIMRSDIDSTGHGNR